ncbi:hypothetical protein A1O3_07220 [Capronia epimyces CBS 606.96]|uniref:Transcription factor domain-containing protein n=1 Tax=Capronia epimyces CBS 606.96 TaxID=1182542 RepID=W9XKA5_9EURO|nr:uncharacterized protein A1O3_07220 [Capronia epimyces CBS 606.96]EXJ80932.1 hypothetical protein A1O3_07220 [Capronia epimyces CBS 606.96]
MAARDPEPRPLLFIVQDSQSFRRRSSKKAAAEAKAITSHVSSRYRGWRKTHHQSLVLDPTTNAILTSTPPIHAVGSLPVPVNDVADQDQTSDQRLLSEYRQKLMETSGRWVYGSFKLHRLQADRSERLILIDGSIVPPPSRLGSQTLDPFAPDMFKYDRELQASLFYYIKIIRPFAVHLLQGWSWIDNLSQVQSSPVLAYAVATFASAFLSGSLRGGPGVVLPPPVEKGQQPLWEIPPWLRLQTHCLAELNAILSDPSSRNLDESCYQAILFLLRLSILFSDGEAGRMHLKALQRISGIVGVEGVDLEKEMAVNKINLISAFLHNSSAVLVRKHPHGDSGRVREVVELDRKLWTCDREWYTFCAAVNARTLTWRSESPSARLLPDTAAAIARMDPNSQGQGQGLRPSEAVELQRCYQIALFLSVYLNNISFNTSAACVRSQVLDLQSRLSRMDMMAMTHVCHCTVFNLLMVGAMATRGFLERNWFVRLVAIHYTDVLYIDQVYRLIAEFIDPLHMVYDAIEDTWKDVTSFRSLMSIKMEPRVLANGNDRHVGDIDPEIENLRPMNYSPDLSKPIKVVEVDDLDVDLG